MVLRQQKQECGNILPFAVGDEYKLGVAVQFHSKTMASYTPQLWEISYWSSFTLNNTIIQVENPVSGFANSWILGNFFL